MIKTLAWNLYGWLHRPFGVFDKADCYHCGYEDIFWCERESVIENSGESYGGEYTIYWAEGYRVCPRCGHHVEFADSN